MEHNDWEVLCEKWTGGVEVRKPSRQEAIAVMEVKVADGVNQIWWSPLPRQGTLEMSSLQLAIMGLELRCSRLEANIGESSVFVLFTGFLELWQRSTTNLVLKTTKTPSHSSAEV